MRNLLLSSATALSMAIIPAASFAQGASPTENVDTVPGSINSIHDKRGDHEMTEDQQSLYEAWPADRQTDYETWPAEYRIYYWSLEPAYQTGYWALTPDQRTRIMAMSEAEQATQWAAIIDQIRGASPAQPVTNTQVSYSSDAMVQGNMNPTAKSEYPVCKGDVQDGCINPRAAGMNWGNRPLDYWPGKPASES